MSIFYFPDVSSLRVQFHGSLESDMMTLGLSPKNTGDFWQVEGGLVPIHLEQKTLCVVLTWRSVSAPASCGLRGTDSLHQQTEGAAGPRGGEAGCAVERIHGWGFDGRAGTPWLWKQDAWAAATIDAKSVTT